MTTRLRIVNPTISAQFNEPAQTEAESYASEGTSVDVVSIDSGPASIESEYDEVLAGPGILKCVEDAVEDGVDGLFITCFGDPAVGASREIADFPVVGGYEPAVLTALSLGERVGIVTVLRNVVPILHRLAAQYGVAGRVATPRVVDIPVLGLHDQDQLIAALKREALQLLDSHEADVIVLGCTGMMGTAKRLQGALSDAGYSVPVVDPTAAAIKWLESSASMGLKPSRTTYMPPPAKERIEK